MGKNEYGQLWEAILKVGAAVNVALGGFTLFHALDHMQNQVQDSSATFNAQAERNDAEFGKAQADAGNQHAAFVDDMTKAEGGFVLGATFFGAGTLLKVARSRSNRYIHSPADISV